MIKIIVQLQVLNYVLETKDSSLLIENNIDDSFFSDYKDEYNFIKDHIIEHGTIPDTVSFLDKFPNFDVIQVSEPKDYLIKKLYEDRNERKLAQVFNTVREQLMNGEVEDALNTYISSQDEVIKSQRVKAVDITKNVERYNTYVDKLDNLNKYYVKTGFNELDEIIGGWDRHEEYATIVARSNMGKSWVLLKSALASVEQGLNVGLYSGEMSAEKVGYRLDTLISHISNSQIIRGDRQIQNDYKKYLDNLPNMFDGSLKVLTPQMIDGPAGVNSLRAFIEKDNLDILFIDQHSLLEDDRKARNPVERAANISKDIKNLQVQKQIPIITVSQQNRTSTENGVDLTHIAQSDRIGQDSTIVIFFEQNEGLLTMHLIKSRDSVNMKDLTYEVDFNTGSFHYIQNNPEEDVQESNFYESEDVEGEDVF